MSAATNTAQGSTFVVRRGQTAVPNQTIYGRYSSLGEAPGESRQLTIQALGVLLLLLSRPERDRNGRRLSVGYRSLEGRGLGRDGLLKALRELGEAGHRYLFKRVDGGRVVTDVVLSEEPITAEEAEAQWLAQRAEDDAHAAAEAALGNRPKAEADQAAIRAAIAELQARLEAPVDAADTALGNPSNAALGNRSNGASTALGLPEHGEPSHDSKESQGSIHYVPRTGEIKEGHNVPAQGAGRRRDDATMGGQGYQAYRQVREANRAQRDATTAPVATSIRAMAWAEKGGAPRPASDRGVGA